MVLGIVILLLTGAIAYFHYAQGLFSAALSAIIATFAAVFAISFHETLVDSLLKGKMADQAHAMALVVMFAAIYVILRMIFDRFVPGNVRYPVLVDKVGAGVMGLIAGMMASGVVVMAAQMLPFGVTIAGYHRFEVRDQTGLTIPAGSGRQAIDGQTFDELKENSLDPAKSSGLLLPVDDFVVGLTGRLSAGALSGDRELKSIHPDWNNELFGARLGIQPGARRTALNLGGNDQVSLAEPGLFLLESIPAVDAELKTVRGQALVSEKGEILKSDGANVLLVVRVNLGYDGTDEDKLLRLSTGAVRLVGIKSDRGDRSFVNFHPIGTLETGTVLFRNKPDDTLAVMLQDQNKPVDFVFLVPREQVFKEADQKARSLDFQSGVFIEVKRLARIDLSGKTATGSPPRTAPGTIVRKEIEALKNIGALGATSSSNAGGTSSTTGRESTAAGPAAAPVITAGELKLSDQLFTPINVGSFEGDPANVTLLSGTATVTGRKFSRLSITATESIARLSAGDFQVTDLSVPAGRKMVQLACTPAGSDPWKWSDDLSQITLVDASGVKYKPSGAWAKVKVGTADRMVARYEAEASVSDVPREEGRPMDVWIAFNVPSGVKITDVQVAGSSIKQDDLSVP